MKYASISLGRFLFAAMLVAVAIPAHAQLAATVPQSDEDHNAQPSDMMGMMSTMRGGGMMEMMRMMHGGGMMGGMPFEHVEGRLAFLKAELKVTPAQEPQWNKFSDAVRSVAQSMKPMHEQMMQGGESTVTRLDRYEQTLGARLEAVRTIKAAFGPLYASLSAEQKKVVDELFMSPMGIF